jgi:hypothetical protein
MEAICLSETSVNFHRTKQRLLFTVAEWSEAWTVLARLDAGIVGSNLTRGMDVYVYVYVYSVFVSSCVGTGLAMSWSLVQGILPTVLDKETEMKRTSFMDAPCSSGSQKWNKINSVILQKTDIFITTAVITSSPTKVKLSLCLVGKTLKISGTRKHT